MLCKDGMYDDSKQWEVYVLPGAFVCFVTVLQYNSKWENVWEKCTNTSYHICYKSVWIWYNQYNKNEYNDETIYPFGYLNHLKFFCENHLK